MLKKVKPKKTIEQIFEESLPSESLFCIANKDYNPDDDDGS